MIEKVTITGYKCLRQVSTSLAPFSVLIGPNDSGKSSFLEILGDARRLHTQEAPARILEHRSARWQIDFRREDGSSGSLRLESPSAKSEVPKLGINDPGNVGQFHDTLDKTRGYLGHLGFLFASDPVSMDPSFIAELSPKQSGRISEFIASRGRGVAAHLARLALGDRARYETIQDELSRITNGRVKEFIVGEDIGSGYPLSFKLFDDTVIPAKQLSQGLLTFLFFLALIHRSDGPQILLVEEPENGLHPLRLHEVVNLLRSLTSQNVQVILTTHSPDLLSACDPSEVRVFLRPQPDSGTEIHELPKDFESVAMRETLGQIWASRGEEGLLDRLPAVKPRIRRQGSKE